MIGRGRGNLSKQSKVRLYLNAYINTNNQLKNSLNHFKDTYVSIQYLIIYDPLRTFT